MNEGQYQQKLIKKLERLFPNCIILKNDPRQIQGMPDLMVLFNNTWAALEIKLSGEASIQPNQEYYIGLLDDMSFASFIYPENEEAVLSDLQHAFGFVRKTRVS